jgi:hypothetical protein
MACIVFILHGMHRIHILYFISFAYDADVCYTVMLHLNPNRVLGESVFSTWATHHVVPCSVFPQGLSYVPAYVCVHKVFRMYVCVDMYAYVCMHIYDCTCMHCSRPLTALYTANRLVYR